MKPLFDSEYFSFVGSSDDRILVHCRKCGQQAEIELKVLNSGSPMLLVTCGTCKIHRSFTLSNVGKSASTSR